MDKILKNWREIVDWDDIVIHLGDVAIGKKRELGGLMATLPGTKWLVMGNHDTQSKMWYVRNGFQCAVDAMAYNGVTLTHHPANSLIGGTDINIHGHVHNSVYNPPHSFNRLLAIEHTDYRPVDFEKFASMARSNEKWGEFRKGWRIPVVKGKLHNHRGGKFDEFGTPLDRRGL